MCAAACGGSDYLVELSTPEETPLPLPLIPTHPPDGTPTYTVTTEPQHGTLEGTFPTAVYTPDADYNGTDEIVVKVEDGDGSVDLTLQIEVTPVNDAPIVGSDVVATSEDSIQMIPVSMLLANDMDVDGDKLTVVGVRSARFGSAVLDGSNVKFTPSANFYGSATLLYSVSDGTSSATGVVTIFLGPVNDLPVAGDNSDFFTDLNTDLTIEPSQILWDDTDVESQLNLSVTSVSNPQHGTVTFTQDVKVGDRITFHPEADYNGPATFDYTMTDGIATATAKVFIWVGPRPPVAGVDFAATGTSMPVTLTFAELLANDSDYEGDTITLTAVGAAVNGTVTKNAGNNDITFTPTANFVGEASFEYTITDGTWTSTAKV